MNGQSEKKKRHPFFVYDFVKATAAIPGLIYYRPKILFETPAAKARIRGGALLIANHMGYVDPVYVSFAVWYRRHRFICMKELMESKAAWLLKKFLCIPIDRENFSMNSFREITDYLKNGDLVSMFPEGHVNDGNSQLQTFKSGMVLMAVRSGVPIIPLYVKKREHWYRRLHIAIGEPVDIRKIFGDRPTMRQIEEITQILYEKEDRLRQMLEGKES